MRYTGFGDQTDPQTLIILVVVFVLVIGFFYMINRMSSKGKTTTTSGKSQQGFNKRTFRKEAKTVGLPEKHRSMLEKLVKKHGVRSPLAVLHNSPQLDSLLRDALDEIETSSSPEETKEVEKLMLFQIKQVIERYAQGKKSLSSSRQLRINQPIVLTTERGSKYKSKVISNLRESIQVTPPQDTQNKIIQWKRWTPLRVYFRKDNDSNFSFPTKVMGYRNYKGVPTLLLQHSKDVKQSQQRRYRRKPLEKPAYFTRVAIIEEGTGKKKQRRAVIDEKSRVLGTVLEVSSGGCSIKTRTPLRSEELIKIEFETDRRNKIVAFGKIRNVRRERMSGAVMHIMFTKLTRNNLNKINYYIYAQDENY